MTDVQTTLLLLAIGAATGITTGLTGAGMSVFVASLLLLGAPIREVIGLSFAITLANAAIAAIPYARKGNIPLFPAITMSLSAAVMVLPGYRISHIFSSSVLNWMIIAGLFAFGVKLSFFSGAAAVKTSNRTTRLPVAYLIIPGVVAGGIMGILGGGGALLMSLMLIFIFRLPVHKALGITFVVMAVASLPGLYCYSRDGFLSFHAAAALIIPSTLFSFLAARVANSLPERKIKAVLGVYLLVISTFLIVKETGIVF